MTTLRAVIYSSKARAGSLKMAVRTRFWSDSPKSCPLCNSLREDVEHVLLHCPAVGSVPHSWEDMLLVAILGIEEWDGGTCTFVEETKNRLTSWWHRQCARPPTPPAPSLTAIVREPLPFPMVRATAS